MIHITSTQKELLTESILLSTTYWVSYADLFETGSLEDGTAQVNAIARVLMLITPYLDLPERERFIQLAEKYLDASTTDW